MSNIAGFEVREFKSTSPFSGEDIINIIDQNELWNYKLDTYAVEPVVNMNPGLGLHYPPNQKNFVLSFKRAVEQ